MLYKITKTLSYEISAYTEAESLEEAKEFFGDPILNDYEWVEENGGERMLERTTYYECADDYAAERGEWEVVDEE